MTRANCKAPGGTAAGVAGVHLMAPANEEALPRVIAEARKRLPSR